MSAICHIHNRIHHHTLTFTSPTSSRECQVAHWTAGHKAECNKSAGLTDGKGAEEETSARSPPLAPASLPTAGARVQLHGLSSAKFNGRFGTVRGAVAANGRYPVELDPGPSEAGNPGVKPKAHTIAVRAENLRVL